jgi:hypothetical protein
VGQQRQNDRDARRGRSGGVGEAWSESEAETNPALSATYAYWNPLNLVREVTYGNGASTFYDYDDAYRVITIEHSEKDPSRGETRILHFQTRKKGVVLMIKTIVAAVFFAILAACATSCRNKAKLEPDPIGYIGHGVVTDSRGRELELNEKLIARIQKAYIRNLENPNLAVRQSGQFDPSQINSRQKVIFSIVDDRILANAIYIDWLVDHRKPRDEARFSTVNNTLRWFYVLQIQQNPILPDAKFRWGKGLKDDEATELEGEGIVVYSITNKGMPEYCDQCLEAGVPVPQNMFGSEWENLGTFDGEEFISTGTFPELLIYVSRDPEGFCLALPRYNTSGSAPDGSQATLFGVICLGTRTSKACFFDNPRNVFFKKNEVVNFRERFVGGSDLIVNNQGTCTDCHAGENPFVIHPDKPAFAAIWSKVTSTVPPRWYDPLVDATWPQNPGPSYILDAVSSVGRCNSCHQQGSAGRFPDLSFPLREYCQDVFSNAVRAPSSGGTMPPAPYTLSEFAPHINALRASCGAVRFPGKVEPGSQTPDPSFISPPMVLGPLYACATAVAVGGAVLDAKVSLLSNDVEVATIYPARSPFRIDFMGLQKLEPGQVITAIQESDGAISAPSAPVTVRDHTVDYPAGLPKPFVDPSTVYECAEVISVRHVPGATVTVFTNGRDPRSFISSWDWTIVHPSGAPFSVGDEFTVNQTLCTDKSDISDPPAVRARTGPTAPLLVPILKPPSIVAGQELLFIENIVEGANVTVEETSSPWSGTFSTPVNWKPDFDIKIPLGRPLRPGDSIRLRQELCSSIGDWSPGDQVQPCKNLPAPLIETPIAGNDFVIVAESLPGARIMIFDSAGVEIGDGSGTVIFLSRPIIAGETLIVVQQLGECTGQFVYRVQAVRRKN